MPSYKITINSPIWIVNAPTHEKALEWIDNNLFTQSGILNIGVPNDLSTFSLTETVVQP